MTLNKVPTTCYTSAPTVKQDFLCQSPPLSPSSKWKDARKKKNTKPICLSFLRLDQHIISVPMKSLCFLVFIYILLPTFANWPLWNADEIMPHRPRYILVSLLHRQCYTLWAIFDKYYEDYANVGQSEETFHLCNALSGRSEKKKRTVRCNTVKADLCKVFLSNTVF